MVNISVPWRMFFLRQLFVLTRLWYLGSDLERFGAHLFPYEIAEVFGAPESSKSQGSLAMVKGSMAIATPKFGGE